MKFKDGKYYSKLIEIGSTPNIYSLRCKIRSPLLISFIKPLKC